MSSILTVYATFVALRLIYTLIQKIDLNNDQHLIVLLVSFSH